VASLKLGLFVNPSADAYRDTLAMVAAAERGGLDLIGIQDHPYQRRFLDTFQLIGDLLARTERLSFFPAAEVVPGLRAAAGG
jgi:alkanesulfonate monooxygenase SsuD/methylene tetrahydromethanopterin reductase-like flavin-dependent oxidoreductase (luciferase family)